MVWKSIWEGVYVRADSVEETRDAVSFMVGEVTVEAFMKSEILKYYEVKE